MTMMSPCIGKSDISSLEDSTSNFIPVYDVVRSKCCHKIGLVTAAADEFGLHDSSLLSPDQVEVLWENDSVRKLVNRDDITLVDRGLLVPGSCVASALDPEGQTGVVADMDILVDLLTSDGDIIGGVDTRELIRVKDFSLCSMIQLG